MQRNVSFYFTHYDELLKKKSKKKLPLSSKMEIENFSVAGGWLENLMEKHSSTTLGGLCGESADDPDSTMDRRPSKCNSKFWR